MCCFSRPVESVTATRIFARSFPPGVEATRQYIVYSMHLQAKEDLAMILPLPVAPNSGDGALRFINLKEYPSFFQAMSSGFPEPPASTLGGLSGPLGGASRGIPLQVQEVGEFEASYVPTIADFARLDARFRLPSGVWEKLPQYRAHGFAVFKLKPGAKTIHPMAFSFPRARPQELFFPTVHIHDGEVHAVADFDHYLYCQRNPGETWRVAHWTESRVLAKNFIHPQRALGIVDPAQHCYRVILQGKLKNMDLRLTAA